MKKILSVFFFFMFLPVLCFAHPSGPIQLNYDLEAKILSVEARHVTRNLEDHYIRKVKIQINDGEPRVESFTRQTMPSIFQADFDIEAQPEDSLFVELFCSQGGTTSELLKVPAEEKKEEKKGNE